ncbi:hypothetical protein [Streptomyces pseudovenezuelae]|uniref:Uncharacterized protein n=1 Tax=Streptomyces pseudovenezuelae TaxID=67350 RepID=A0ABT6M2W9_9ACTN|nr:hypothetical protein [Streptomyces pseudovenezuelae]MDH6222902.1 hypothetical protein [Streptomyces pseudovenezuelae]
MRKRNSHRSGRRVRKPGIDGKRRPDYVSTSHHEVSVEEHTRAVHSRAAYAGEPGRTFPENSPHRASPDVPHGTVIISKIELTGTGRATAGETGLSAQLSVRSEPVRRRCGGVVLTLPIEPMLAESQRELPPDSALPGDLSFEQKPDGFRAVVFPRADLVRMQSRRGTDLTPSLSGHHPGRGAAR